jgi:hypothetical protein
VSVPGHLAADAEVPILGGPQCQGDVMVIPLSGPAAGGELLPDTGVQVVRGEATGNTHWLHRGFDSTGVRWAAADDPLVLGRLSVPEGESALLIHTDEHGANGIGPGAYALHRKREQAAVVRPVLD